MKLTFEAWERIPRLNKDMIVTEKIDGTNACIVISEPHDGEISLDDGWPLTLFVDGSYYDFACQSRKRLIVPESDNFGFATWAFHHAVDLIRRLGPGRHYGEWWGQGIQRHYDLQEKRFSLFNAGRWEGLSSTGGTWPELPNVCVVPTLATVSFNTEKIEKVMDELHVSGSYAAPGFMNPEGVVVFHTASRNLFKYTFENDGGKWTA